MSDRIPGSSESNPIWHRDWAIWVSGEERHDEAYRFAHPEADLDDNMDRRHGFAPSVETAKSCINEITDSEIEAAARRQKGRI